MAVGYKEVEKTAKAVRDRRVNMLYRPQRCTPQYLLVQQHFCHILYHTARWQTTCIALLALDIVLALMHARCFGIVLIGA
jgi:hypothetical protein